MAGVKKRNVLVLLLSCVGWPPGLAAMEFAAPVGLYVNRDGLIQLRADQRMPVDRTTPATPFLFWVYAVRERTHGAAGIRGRAVSAYRAAANKCRMPWISSKHPPKAIPRKSTSGIRPKTRSGRTVWMKGFSSNWPAAISGFCASR